MFAPVLIDEFIKSYKKNNPKTDAAALRETLVGVVEAKKVGGVCNICGRPIWAIGTATVG
jgi:hypothetical protein